MKAVVEPLGDLGDGEGTCSSRCELDGQGQAVQPGADVVDDGCGLAVGLEAGVGCGRPAGEQQGRIRRGQRRDRPHLLARDQQRFPARGEDVDVLARREQVVDERRCRAHQVFAIVEHQQHPAVATPVSDALLRGIGRLRDVERGCHHSRYQSGIGHRCQLDDERAVPACVRGPGHLDGQPRLAGTAGADHRRQAGPLEQLGDVAHLAVAPDERRQRRPEVAVAPARRRRRHGRGRIDEQRRVVSQHGRLQALQLGSGFQPELLGQRDAPVLVDPQRVRLSPGPIQRHHQLGPQPLAQGMLGDQGVEFGDELCVTSHGQLDVNPLLRERQPKLVEVNDVRPGKVVGGEVGEGWATPQPLRRCEVCQRQREIPDGHRPPGSRCERLQPACIDVDRVDRQHVSGRSQHHQIRRSERPAQLGHQPLECVGRPGRRVVLPESLGQPVGRHSPSRVQGEHRQHGAELGAADRKGPVLALDLKWAQESHLH